MLTTFSDLIDHALQYLGGDTNRANSDRARRAVQLAFGDLPTRHPWSYFKVLGQINTVAHYATGTIAYDHTGGTNEREVTLSDGTWPDWAASGVIVIDDVPYEVDERVSSTVLTLTSGSNPGTDVDASTSYQLYRDTYPLPSDALTIDELVLDHFPDRMIFRPASEWAGYRRRNVGPGKPLTFTFTGDAENTGAMVVRFWPPPDAVYVAQFLYKKRPSRLALDRREAGLVTVTASTTVTGSSTAFDSSMVGSVIRVGPDGKNPVTGPDGPYPPDQERVIESVESTTSLTVTSAFTTARTSHKYVISDLADVEPDVMLRFLHREIERQCRLLARMKPIAGEEDEYQRALAEARSADGRYTGPRSAGGESVPRYRLRDYPPGSDFG